MGDDTSWIGEVARRLPYRSKDDAARNLTKVIAGDAYPRRTMRHLAVAARIEPHLIAAAIDETLKELSEEFRKVQVTRRYRLDMVAFYNEFVGVQLPPVGLNVRVPVGQETDLAAQLRLAMEVAHQKGSLAFVRLYPEERNEFAFIHPDSRTTVRSALLPPSRLAMQAATLLGLGESEIRLGWSPELARAQVLEQSLHAALSMYRPPTEEAEH